jgi:hypothetical protein
LRWKLALQEFDFNIEYIKGNENVVADGMSRFCEQTGSEMNTEGSNEATLSSGSGNQTQVAETLDMLCTVQDSSEYLHFIDEYEVELHERDGARYCQCSECESHTEEYCFPLHELDVKIPRDKYQLISRVHNSRAGHH